MKSQNDLVLFGVTVLEGIWQWASASHIEISDIGAAGKDIYTWDNIHQDQSSFTGKDILKYEDYI